MAQPIRTVYVVIGFLILLLVIIIVVGKMIYSVHEYRTAALLMADIIKTKSPLLGSALEYLFRTFIWF